MLDIYTILGSKTPPPVNFSVNNQMIARMCVRIKEGLRKNGWYISIYMDGIKGKKIDKHRLGSILFVIGAEIGQH